MKRTTIIIICLSASCAVLLGVILGLHLRNKPNESAFNESDWILVEKEYKPFENTEYSDSVANISINKSILDDSKVDLLITTNDNGAGQTPFYTLTCSANDFYSSIDKELKFLGDEKTVCISKNPTEYDTQPFESNIRVIVKSINDNQKQGDNALDEFLHTIPCTYYVNISDLKNAGIIK